MTTQSRKAKRRRKERRCKWCGKVKRGATMFREPQNPDCPCRLCVGHGREVTMTVREYLRLFTDRELPFPAELLGRPLGMVPVREIRLVVDWISGKDGER